MARHYVEANQVDNQLVRFDESTCIVAPKFHPYPFESKLTEGSTGTVYRDDFSDRRGGWPNHQDSHYILGGYELSNYKVQAKSDGQLAASGFPVESPAHTTTFLENIIAAYGPWWSDFRASVATDAVLETVSRKTSTEFLQKNRPAAGLVFRMNLNGCYALLMSRVIDRKKLSVELVRRDFEGDSYKETEIVPWTEVAPNPSAPTTELSVEVVGDRISMFVDSQEVTTARDDAFSQGLVGFIISGPGRATFRDLVVEQR